MEKQTVSEVSKNTRKNPQIFGSTLSEKPEGNLNVLVSTISEGASRLAMSLNRTLPQVSKFVRSNWKPMAAIAGLGLGAYGILKVRQNSEHAPKRARRKVHS